MEVEGLISNITLQRLEPINYHHCSLNTLAKKSHPGSQAKELGEHMAGNSI